MTTTACYHQTIFTWEVQVRDIKVSWSNIFSAYDKPNDGIQGLLQVETFCISWKTADEVIPFWSFMKLPKMKLNWLVGFLGIELSMPCHPRSPQAAAIYSHIISPHLVGLRSHVASLVSAKCAWWDTMPGNPEMIGSCDSFGKGYLLFRKNSWRLSMFWKESVLEQTPPIITSDEAEKHYLGFGLVSSLL